MTTLTPSEERLLALVDEGLSNKAIAYRLGWSFGTARTEISRLYDKLDIPDNGNCRVYASNYFNKVVNKS